MSPEPDLRGFANGKQTPLYVVWKGMVGRCHNPNNHKYQRYGARGITVCERWRDFKNFAADMGPKPSPAHSIDRINNNGNYEPSNCRWATRSEQLRNYSGNRLLTFNGETKCLAEWAEAHGLIDNTLRTRLNKGWSMARALTEPLRDNGRWPK